MNTQSNAVPDPIVGAEIIAAPLHSPTRPMYWSIRRELWENRSIYIAPLAVAALFLAGFLVSTIHLPAKMRQAISLDPMHQQQLIEQPYNLAAVLLMGATFIVAIFYCLDALHGERRDRSILFWKSLPVSDLTTVLSKVIIPTIILPLLTFAITVATQWLMLLLSSAVLLGSGQSAAMLWEHLPLLAMWMVLLFHLVAVHGLYYAPIYGWLLLVSGWARRAAFLWAGLPLLAIGVAEKIAFGTSHFADLLGHRLGGGPENIPFTVGSMPMGPFPGISPGEFMVSSGLWIGLAVFAAFLAAAVRLRRYQGPI